MEIEYEKIMGTLPYFGNDSAIREGARPASPRVGISLLPNTKQVEILLAISVSLNYRKSSCGRNAIGT